MKKDINGVVLEVLVGRINLRNGSIVNRDYVLKPASAVRAELGGPDIYKSSYSIGGYVKQPKFKRRG